MSVLYHDSVLVFIFYIIYHEGQFLIEGNFRERERTSCVKKTVLNYTLTGVGGFMAAGILMPMTRFALDPVLRKEAGTDMVAVAQVKDITTEPKRFDFKVKQVDGWYKSEEPKSAWVHKDESGDIVAFSPVCKHLGCTVNWNSDKAHPNQFFCPCHGAVTQKTDEH